MSAEAVVRVVIADDHALFRAGMVEMLDRMPGLSVVAQAGSGGEVLELVEQWHPDVALLDVQMPGPDITSSIRQICERSPSTAVVVVTASEDPQVMLSAIDAGAAGYVLKAVKIDVLVATIRSAAAGVDAVCIAASRPLLLSARAHAQASGPVFSARERHVLAGLQAGKGNKQIALDLGLSEATVKRNLSNVYAKLGVSTRSQAILAARSRETPSPSVT